MLTLKISCEDVAHTFYIRYTFVEQVRRTLHVRPNRDYLLKISLDTSVRQRLNVGISWSTRCSVTAPLGLSFFQTLITLSNHYGY